MTVKGDRAIWEAETGGLSLLNGTLGDLLDHQAEQIGDKEALIYSYPEIGLNLRLNFRQYRDEVDRLAKGLIALGVEKGEHVAVWATNLPEWILLQMATARIGAVLVTINTAYRASEVEYVLQQGDVAYLFMQETVRGNSYLDSVYSIAPELKEVRDPARETLHSTNLPRLKRVVLLGKAGQPTPGLLPYAEVIAGAESVADEELAARKTATTSRDTVMIMYTSGTTGFPKGAMLSHYNLLNTMSLGRRGVDYSHDRYVNPMPFFHIAGAGFIVQALQSGMPTIGLIGFDPVKVMELIQQEKGTMTFCVPTMLIAIINHPRFVAGDFDLSSLRLAISGGASVPVVLLEGVKAKIGADVQILFGMTESTGCGTSTLADDSFELKSATVGKPYPYLEMKIVEPATGEAVGLGESGELMMRGYSVMEGYYNMPEKTRDAIDEDGWLHTGDLAKMNAQGYLNIVGRVKDMIIRGGENIYPAEIEAFLMRHPKIAEVQIVGVPDSYMGEEAVALLKLKPGEEVAEDEMREYARANISRYKVPKYFKFVSQYPMTASGKVKKFELRRELIVELGLEEIAKVKTA